MPSKDRLIEYHLSRLTDKFPHNRLDAIQELVLLEATDALDALQKVFASDDEEEVRKAAQQAGRALFKLRVQKEKASS